MSTDELADTDAWRAGWVYLENGFFWETHEVLEPVWMATLPNSVERHFVQAVIQTANAALKHRMDRPRAVLRLCDMVDQHLIECRGLDTVLGLPVARVQSHVRRLRRKVASA